MKIQHAALRKFAISRRPISTITPQQSTYFHAMFRAFPEDGMELTPMIYLNALLQPTNTQFENADYAIAMCTGQYKKHVAARTKIDRKVRAKFSATGETGKADCAAALAIAIYMTGVLEAALLPYTI